MSFELASKLGQAGTEVGGAVQSPLACLQTLPDTELFKKMNQYFWF